MPRLCSSAKHRASTKINKDVHSWERLASSWRNCWKASACRKDVFIANVIKCRPPGNRDPLPEEINACRPFLDRQIELIQPKLVVTLGRFSMARAFPKARISRIHGQPRKIGGVLYYPMYHPAAALHQPSLRSVVKEDMLRIPELIKQAAQIAESPLPTEAEQLRLF